MLAGAMSKAAILRRLEPIFRNVLDSNLVLTEDPDASQVPLWDSLNHIILVVEIEMHLGVTLSTDEIAHLNNVGEMVALLEGKGVSG
jgi:acyl carrier protein